MTNLQFLKYVCFLLLIASCNSASVGGPAPNQKPNIIFIMADDLGYGDLGCYGQQLIQTPNIDRLAASGLRFTQAYAGGPVCTPSRSVLMTGLHNGHTPARDNIPHYKTYLQEEEVTVAEVLKAAGYRTGGIGKWSLGDAGTVGQATNQGFDMWFGYLNQDHAHYYYTEYLDDSEAVDNNFRYELPGNTESHAQYSHDLMTERALDFISDSHEEPFFFYAAYTIPHYSSKSEDPDGLAVPSLSPYEDKDWPESAKKYAAMVHRLDRDVGRIVKLIDSLGIRDNTLIVFTSDNGGHDSVWKEFKTSGPLRGYKRDLTEGGIRVPFIASWPGNIPSGRTSDAVISFQDMLPTFAELAGVSVPKNIDGISIVDVLKGKQKKTKHDYLYWDYGHNRGSYAQAVRMGKWKGIRPDQGKAFELYNLEEDINEQNNLATDYPKVVKKIEKAMEEAFTPDERYEIGKSYQGGPIWKKEVKE